MRSLLWNSEKYEIEITGLATRGNGPVEPESLEKKEQVCKNCILAFITVEEQDNLSETSEKISEEILEMARETGRNLVVLVPFAHLSNNLSTFKIGKIFFDILEEKLHGKIKIERTHFGSDKSLLLKVPGHPGNIRYREF